MLHLAVHVPCLSLEALTGLHDVSGQALAIMQSGRVVRMNPIAQAAGILDSQSSATARAICPDIALLDRDLHRELEALKQLACCALRFTPRISLIEPDAQRVDRAGLILEVGRSLRLFGGAGALARQLRTDLERAGFSARLCMAPTATGAWLLAQQQDGLIVETLQRLREVLRGVSAHTLRSSQAHLEALDATGLKTIGQLTDLPRAGLARRWGTDLLNEIDRALGDRADPYPEFDPPACFDAQLELPAVIESSAQLLEASKRLILQLCGWLRARHEAALRLDLSANHGNRLPPTVISVRVERASCDADHWTLLLREHLQRSRLSAPAQALQLHCEWTVEQQGQVTDLFPDAQADREQLDRLIERLQARLGREHVLRLDARADHRPEQAQHSTPIGKHSTLVRREPRRSHPWALPRPLWLIDPPVALIERNNRPYLNSPLRLLAGPERIETGWWDRGLALRDYFIAEDHSNRLFWIFRARLPDTDGQRAQSGWFLQGRYG